jgi:excisionase family DNA binding protein
MDEDMLNATEVAELVGVQADTIRDWAQAGKIPHFKLGGPTGVLRFRRGDITDWLDRQRVRAAW